MPARKNNTMYTIHKRGKLINYRVSDYCLVLIEQLLSYIMVSNKLHFNEMMLSPLY